MPLGGAEAPVGRDGSTLRLLEVDIKRESSVGYPQTEK